MTGIQRPALAVTVKKVTEMAVDALESKEIFLLDVNRVRMIDGMRIKSESFCQPFTSRHHGLQDDQTYETQSRISFVASRFENGERITCEANNPVLEAHNEEPERASVELQVKCEYVVSVIITWVCPLKMRFG